MSYKEEQRQRERERERENHKKQKNGEGKEKLNERYSVERQNKREENGNRL
jgi:hypothetical protein